MKKKKKQVVLKEKKRPVVDGKVFIKGECRKVIFNEPERVALVEKTSKKKKG